MSSTSWDRSTGASTRKTRLVFYPLERAPSPVRNTGSTTATVTIGTSDIGEPLLCSFDSFVFVHAPSFNPADASDSCLNGDGDVVDDEVLCSELTLTMPPNSTRVFVVTGFDADDAFNYQLNVDAPATVTVSRCSPHRGRSQKNSAARRCFLWHPRFH